MHFSLTTMFSSVSLAFASFQILKPLSPTYFRKTSNKTLSLLFHFHFGKINVPFMCSHHRNECFWNYLFWWLRRVTLYMKACLLFKEILEQDHFYRKCNVITSFFELDILPSTFDDDQQSFAKWAEVERETQVFVKPYTPLWTLFFFWCCFTTAQESLRFDDRALGILFFRVIIKVASLHSPKGWILFLFSFFISNMQQKK